MRTARLKFDALNSYQSFIDASNVWGVEQTDTWNPEMGHSPMGLSKLVEVQSNDK